MFEIYLIRCLLQKCAVWHNSIHNIVNVWDLVEATVLFLSWIFLLIQSSFFTIHERKIQILREMSYFKGRNRLIYTCLKKSWVINSLQKWGQQLTKSFVQTKSRTGKKPQTVYTRDLKWKGMFLSCRQQWGFQSYFLTDLLTCLWHVALRSNLRSHNLFPISKMALFRDSRCFLNEIMCQSGKV